MAGSGSDNTEAILRCIARAMARPSRRSTTVWAAASAVPLP
jgi:hypothetical protein